MLSNWPGANLERDAAERAAGTHESIRDRAEVEDDAACCLAAQDEIHVGAVLFRVRVHAELNVEHRDGVLAGVAAQTAKRIGERLVDATEVTADARENRCKTGQRVVDTADAFARSQAACNAARSVAAVEVVTDVAVAGDLEDGELVSDHRARRGARCRVFEALVTRADVCHIGRSG